MLIATRQIDARFGHKQQVVERVKSWASDVGASAGSTHGRLLGGSIGALEATLRHDWEFASLADLESAWSALAANPGHARWSAELEPLVVSGTARWEIFRLL